jgi:two-component system, NarL family, nitrate/nitrite response regulator NarL
VIVSDQPVMRLGLVALAEAAPELVVQDAVGGDSQPVDVLDGADLLLMDGDWGAPEEGAQALARWLEPGLPAIVLIPDADDLPALWPLLRAAGSWALLPRAIDEATLAAAVDGVLAGLHVLHPDFTELLGPRNRERGAASDTLTPREREVLALMADGLTNRSIAYQLAISEHTVKFHINAILGKLGAQSRTEAVVRATQLGWLAL